MRILIGVLLGYLSLSTVSTAQDAAVPSAESGIRLGQEQVQRLRVGIRVAAGGPCRGIVATVPVPKDWPEQQVEIIDEQISTEVKNVTYRELDGLVKQLVVQIPRLDPNESAEAVITLQIRRRAIEGPTDVDQYVVPTRPPKEIRINLAASPYIESRHSQIRQLAPTVVKDKETAWQKVEAIYDYVRDNVVYQESELKGAVDTLRDKQGDCEGMTSLFIALCRANKIPARMVWVTDHSYPEFYLEDASGEGHWFPCQISGARAFGSMPETRPILQKGDNFKIPETKKNERYVAVHLKANVVGTKPTVTEILEFAPTE